MAWPDYERPSRHRSKRFFEAVRRTFPNGIKIGTISAIIGLVIATQQLFSVFFDKPLPTETLPVDRYSGQTDAAALDRGDLPGQLAENTVREFAVRPDERLVVRWRNPTHCRTEIRLIVNAAPQDDDVSDPHILTGQAGNLIVKPSDRQSMSLTWTPQVRTDAPNACEDVQGEFMPLRIVVQAFVEKTVP